MAEQRSTLIIEISSEQAARNARALDRELQSIERTGNYATTSMNSMSVAARQLAGYLAGVVTVGTAIAKMDTYTGLNNKLKLVTKSQSELNTAMNDTFKIAQNTAQAWDSVAQIYQRFSDNAQRLNITQAKTAELTDTVAKAIAISGGSAASAEAALVQFSQALASNVLRGEELNSVMEQAPGLAKAIAQGMGITVGQLRSVAAEGKITGDVLVDALTKARGSVNELFGKTDFTIAQSFTQLSNEVTKFVGEAGKGSGAAKVLSSSISALAENLAPIANAGAALAIGMLTKAMISNAAATTSATYSLIAKVDASIAERNANIAAAQAEVASAAAEAQSTQVTLTNIKATHAQIMAEIELEKVRLKAQITDQGRMAATTRMAQLGRLQAQVALEVAAAESAQTASSARLSAALTAQTVATSRLALAKSALMAIFSPMGLAIAATAATFYLLSSSSDEVKESLATQADSVESLTKKYLELNTVQALVEGVRLRKEIEQQNDVIDDASSATKRFAYIQKELFKLSGNDYADYQKAVTSIAKGASDAGDLLNKMIASGRFSQNQIDKLVEFSGAVAESKNKIEQNSNALKLLNATSGQHVEVTADSIKQLTIQTNLTKVATQNFTDMKTQMLDSLQAQVEFIRLNGGSEEQVNSLNKVIQAYSLNQLTATDAVKKFNSSAKVPSDVIKGLIDYASKTDQSKFAMNQANTELKAIQENGSKAKQGFIDASQGASTAMSEVDKLNEKMKEFNKTIAQRKFDAGYQQILITQYGKTPEQAAEMLKIRKDAEKIGLKNPTAEMLKNGLSVLSIENKLKDTIEAKSKAEKDHTKELERQQKLQEKQTVLLAGNNEQTRNMLRVYQSFRNAGLGDKQARVMTAQVGRENDFRNSDMFGSHKDANNGYTNTGFISWQKGRSTQLMQFLQGQGVLDKNGKIQQSQDALDAMAKFLMQEIATGKSYGKTKNALNNDNLSYRELEKIVGQNFIGWDYNGKKLGKDKAAQHLSKQDNYFNQISKILGANPENVMSSIKDLSKFEDEAFKARAKTEEEIKQLQAKYDTEAIQRSKARDEEITQATILGQTELLPKIKERYDAQDKLAQLQIDEDLNSYKWTENQKLVYTYQTNKLRLDAEGKLSDDVKELAKKTLDEQMLYETQKRLQTNSLGIGQIQLDAQSYVRQKQNPTGFQQDQLDSETINKYRELQLKYSSQRGDIFTLVDEENTRNQQLLDAHEKFLMARKALDEKYQVDQQDIARNQFDAQLALYGRLISTTSTTWGSMTQIMRDSAGEQSALYKLMFGIQQTMAIATATINAYQAYSSVLAEPLIPIAIKIPLANTILGLGMANVGMIAGQAIAGFSNGGYTGSGGKFDPAGIVHKGEVVFSQEDIARWGGVGNVESMRKGNMIGFAEGGYVTGNNKTQLNSSYPALPSFKESRFLDSLNSANGDAPVITINVSVQSDGSSSVDVKGDASQNLKQFAKFIGTEVERVVRKECNQGGFIDKEFRKRR